MGLSKVDKYLDDMTVDELLHYRQRLSELLHTIGKSLQRRGDTSYGKGFDFRS